MIQCNWKIYTMFYLLGKFIKLSVLNKLYFVIIFNEFY